MATQLKHKEVTTAQFFFDASKKKYICMFLFFVATFIRKSFQGSPISSSYLEIFQHRKEYNGGIFFQILGRFSHT